MGASGETTVTKDRRNDSRDPIRSFCSIVWGGSWRASNLNTRRAFSTTRFNDMEEYSHGM